MPNHAHNTHYYSEKAAWLVGAVELWRKEVRSKRGCGAGTALSRQGQGRGLSRSCARIHACACITYLFFDTYFGAVYFLIGRAGEKYSE